MIRRHAPAFRGMPAYYIDFETGAPLFNDRGELATDNDIDRFESRPDVVAEWDRLIFDICTEDRRKGKKLPARLLQAEFEAFQRSRIGEPA